MSSFSARVKKAEKEKGTKSNTSTEKGGNAESEGDILRTTSGEVMTSVESSEVINTREEFYGEDQEETRDKPKFERTIPLDRIRPNPYQPRKTFDPDKLNDLADGMKEHGWIGGGLPVRAHATEPNTYELVWGERRWRAASLAGLKAIPCVVSIYTDEDMIEKGLLENVQREDLTNLEEGQAYVNLLALRTEAGKPRYSIRHLAVRIGKDKSYIEDRLQYARVPIDIQQLAEDQPDISPRIIRELGELAKILGTEERVPVLEGVRDGKLRIEDVRAIRKDVEQQSRTEPTDDAHPTQIPVERTSDLEQPSTSKLPAAPTEATDTLSSTKGQEGQPKVSRQEPAMTSIIEGTEQVVTVPTSPLTSVIAVNVFEKTLKRDNEAFERIFQRVATTVEKLTEPEQTVLLYYLKRWDTTIQDLIQRVESVEE